MTAKHKMLWGIIALLLPALWSRAPAEVSHEASSLADSALAQQWVQKADYFYQDARFDSARALYHTAAKYYRLKGLWKKAVGALLNEGTAWRYMEKYDSAFTAAQRAAVLIEKKLSASHPLLIRTYNLSGNCVMSQGQYDRALTYYQKALALCRTSNDSTNSNFADIYNNIALVYDYKGQPYKAINFHKKALKIRIKTFGPEHPDVGASYFNLASLYKNLGYLDIALTYIKKDLAINQKLYAADHIYIAQDYNSLGTIYMAKGQFNEALRYYNKALQIRLAKYGEASSETGMIYFNLGLLYSYLGDYAEARRYLERDLALNLKIFGAQHLYTAQDYQTLGTFFLNEKKYDPALKFYTKALYIFEQSLSDNIVDLADLCQNMGLAYFSKKKYDQAELFYRRALTLMQKQEGSNNLAMADLYANLGRLNTERNAYAKALRNYRKSLLIFQNLLGLFHFKTADAYLKIAHLYYQQSKTDSALYFIQQALHAVSPSYDYKIITRNPPLKALLIHRVSVLILKEKANIFKQKYAAVQHISFLETANHCYRLLVQIARKVRQNYLTEQSTFTLENELSDVYEQAIDNAYQLYLLSGKKQHLEEVFYFMEAGKAVTLLRSVRKARALHFSDIPDSLTKKENALGQNLNYYRTTLMNEKAKGYKADSLLLDYLQKRAFHLSLQYQSLLNVFEQNYPQYYSTMYQTNMPVVQEIQNILDDSTAVLEYFLGNYFVYITAIGHNSMTVIKQNIGSSFKQNVKQLLNAIKKIDKRDFIKFSNRLYFSLIEPVASRIEHKNRLIIIPDGELYYIPFEVLNKNPHKNNFSYAHFKYLIRKHALSYTYSAAFYLNSLSRKKRLAASRNFIGFAPVYDGTQRILSAVSPSRGHEKGMRPHVPKLLYTEEEVGTIANSFRSHHLSALVLYRSEATEQNFKSLISQYQYIHIASHAIINAQTPYLSRILFTHSNGGKEDDIFYSGEAYSLNLHARLLVLSSCQSGLGKLIKGEGFLAFTRGFLYAGADNMVVSLWRVFDKSTSFLMKAFYRNLLTGKNFARSLQMAKLSLLKNGDSAAPKHWAGFILIGE